MLLGVTGCLEGSTRLLRLTLSPAQHCLCCRPPHCVCHCAAQAFFHGGLYSNDATTPVNGSHMEVMDLRTLSPYLIQVMLGEGGCQQGGWEGPPSGGPCVGFMGEEDARC